MSGIKKKSQGPIMLLFVDHVTKSAKQRSAFQGPRRGELSGLSLEMEYGLCSVGY